MIVELDCGLSGLRNDAALSDGVSKLQCDFLFSNDQQVRAVMDRNLPYQENNSIKELRWVEQLN